MSEFSCFSRHGHDISTLALIILTLEKIPDHLRIISRHIHKGWHWNKTWWSRLNKTNHHIQCKTCTANPLRAVFLYCCPDCPRCPANTIAMGQARKTWSPIAGEGECNTINNRCLLWHYDQDVNKAELWKKAIPMGQATQAIRAAIKKYCLSWSTTPWKHFAAAWDNHWDKSRISLHQSDQLSRVVPQGAGRVVGSGGPHREVPNSNETELFTTSGQFQSDQNMESEYFSWNLDVCAAANRAAPDLTTRYCDARDAFTRASDTDTYPTWCTTEANPWIHTYILFLVQVEFMRLCILSLTRAGFKPMTSRSCRVRLNHRAMTDLSLGCHN